MQTYTKTFVVCPHCDAGTDSSIDHLERGYRFGPWACDECGKYFTGVALGSDTTVEKAICQGRVIKTLDLLVLEPSDKPVYFVLKGNIYPARHASELSDADHKEYFYEEHSCPTNWLRDITMVSADGDTDPHGFLKFVRFVVSPEMPNDPNEEDQVIIAAFPEIL